jgi:hypothetical protein
VGAIFFLRGYEFFSTLDGNVIRAWCTLSQMRKGTLRPVGAVIPNMLLGQFAHLDQAGVLGQLFGAIGQVLRPLPP